MLTQCMVMCTLYSDVCWVAFNWFRRESFNNGDAEAAVRSCEIHTCTCDCQVALSLGVIWQGRNLYSNTCIHNSSISGPDNVRSREANSRARESGTLSHRDHCWHWVLQEDGIDCEWRRKKSTGIICSPPTSLFYLDDCMLICCYSGGLFKQSYTTCVCLLSMYLVLCFYYTFIDLIATVMGI